MAIVTAMAVATVAAMVAAMAVDTAAVAGVVIVGVTHLAVASVLSIGVNISKSLLRKISTSKTSASVLALIVK